ELLRRPRRLLPGRAQLMAEAGMRLRRFRQHLVGPQAVPADRGAADEHVRLALEPRDQPYDLAGHVDARVDNFRALRVSPPTVADRLAGEVDDGIDTRVRRNLIEAGDQRDRR